MAAVDLRVGSKPADESVAPRSLLHIWRDDGRRVAGTWTRRLISSVMCGDSLLVRPDVRPGKQLARRRPSRRSTCGDKDGHLGMQVAQDLSASSAGGEHPSAPVADSDDPVEALGGTFRDNGHHRHLCARTAGEVEQVHPGHDPPVACHCGRGDRVFIAV